MRQYTTIIYTILIFLSLFFVAEIKGQEGAAGKIISSFVQVRDAGINNKKPIKRPCLLWLPHSYSDNTNSPYHPLIVYLYSSDDFKKIKSTSIHSSKKAGPFYFLQNKRWNGTAEYGGLCGQPGYIVFALQPGRGSYTDPAELDYAIAQLLLRFRIDKSRIVFTGINEGARTIIKYISDSGRVNQPRIVIPINPPIEYESHNVAENGMKLWVITSGKDNNTGILCNTNAMRLSDRFNQVMAGSARQTLKFGVDCCPDKYFDPYFREAESDSLKQELSIYEWAMKNMAWGDGLPPIYDCPQYVSTPYQFAGFISVAKRAIKEVTNQRCSIPVYTTDGKIARGKMICLNASGENVISDSIAYYGFSTLKLKGALPDKYIMTDVRGKIITIK